MADQPKTSTTFADVVYPPEAFVEKDAIRDPKVIAAIFEADQKAEDEAMKHGQVLPFAPVTP